MNRKDIGRLKNKELLEWHSDSIKTLSNHSMPLHVRSSAWSEYLKSEEIILERLDKKIENIKILEDLTKKTEESYKILIGDYIKKSELKDFLDDSIYNGTIDSVCYQILKNKFLIK